MVAGGADMTPSYLGLTQVNLDVLKTPYTDRLLNSKKIMDTVVTEGGLMIKWLERREEENLQFLFGEVKEEPF